MLKDNKITVKNARVIQEIAGGCLTTSVEVDALDVFKNIGRAAGLYFDVSVRDTRIVIEENDGVESVVKQEDVAYHGSPCWMTREVITKDPERIAAIKQFKNLLDTIFADWE